MAAAIVRLVVSLVAVKAESDCSSLLMSKQRSSIVFQDGKCIEQNGDRHTKKHDKVVKFEALDGEFSSLTFQLLPLFFSGHGHGFPPARPVDLWWVWIGVNAG